MSITIENVPPAKSRNRAQTPTAYIKSEYGAQKIAEIFSIPLKSLKVYPDFNKRVDYALDDLKLFIKANGIAFPPLRLMYIDNELYIDEGHRRFAACVELDLDPETPIPVYIGEASSPEERLARQVTSNSGKNYTFIEMVYVVKELIQKYHKDQNTVATLIGKSQGAVSQMTKFFGYSSLLITAISMDDVKYTRVLEWNRKGLTESEILEIIAKEKRAKQTALDSINNNAAVKTSIDEQINDVSEEDFEDFEDATLDDSEITQSSMENSEQNTDRKPDLKKTDKNKLDKLLDDESEVDSTAPRTIKSAGQVVTPDKSQYTTKKANPAKLLTDFLACAEIVDNGNGTVSYIVSKAESNALQKGANNI